MADQSNAAKLADQLDDILRAWFLPSCRDPRPVMDCASDELRRLDALGTKVAALVPRWRILETVDPEAQDPITSCETQTWNEARDCCAADLAAALSANPEANANG